MVQGLHSVASFGESARIPHWIGYHSGIANVEIHGLADASSRVYAAVTYLRVVLFDNDIPVNTKVALIKTVSIPRHELNAMVLLTRLLRWVQFSLKLESALFFGWTDSAVTLALITQYLSEIA